MSIQKPLSVNDPRNLQVLDIERVREYKPKSVTTSGLSIVSWHNITTVLRLLLKTLSMPFHTSIHYIEMHGVERTSGDKISVSYIGDKSSYEYVKSCLFESEPEICGHQRITWWSINRQVKNARLQTDLLIGDVDFPLDYFVSKKKALISPRWLKQKVFISDRWQDVLTNLRRKTRREALRSIRKHNLKARVVRDADSDRYFYDRLYKPYIHRRYGSQATVVDRRRFLSECANGQLIQILQDDKILGVVLVHISSQQLTIAWMGIDEEVSDTQLNGVTDALDLYSLMFAYTQGCTVMDMGGSRPLIDDGVLRYKKKWGAHVSQGLIPKGSVFYSPCRITPSLESFLENNPMILTDGKKLTCVSWKFIKEHAPTEIDDDTRELDQFTETFNKMYIPGVDEFLCFLVFDEGVQYEHIGIIEDIPYKVSRISRSSIPTVLLSI